MLLKKTDRPKGSILLETLISILILGLIVLGSIYSYSFVYQRIRSQRQQRIALGILQGGMELAILSQDPNVLLDPNIYFDEQIFALLGPDIEHGIDTNPIDDMINIRVWMILNGLPIELSTRINPL